MALYPGEVAKLVGALIALGLALAVAVVVLFALPGDQDGSGAQQPSPSSTSTPSGPHPAPKPVDGKPYRAFEANSWWNSPENTASPLSQMTVQCLRSTAAK